MSQEHIILYWIYVIVMLTGALVIAIMSRNSKGVPKINYFISLFIPMWSAILYIPIATLIGTNNINAKTIFYAKYLDCIVTIPLLLILLCLTGMYNMKKNNTILFGLAFSSIIMILFIFIGSLQIGINRYICFFIEVLISLIVLWVIWGPIEDIASTQGYKVYGLYKNMALYFTIFFGSYFISWIMSSSVYDLVSKKFCIYIFIIISVLFKLGFGLVNIIGLRKLEENE